MTTAATPSSATIAVTRRENGSAMIRGTLPPYRTCER
jgi:hypothetical protein